MTQQTATSRTLQYDHKEKASLWAAIYALLAFELVSAYTGQFVAGIIGFAILWLVFRAILEHYFRTGALF